MRLEQMYQEVILDHYRNPHGRGLREPFDAEAFHINPTCGDEVRLRVKLSGSGADATVADVSYDALGCSISQAATSMLTDLVVGRSVADSLRILDAYQEMAQGRGQVEPDDEVLGDAVAFAGVARYPARVKCALLGWMAFKDAVLRGTNGHAEQRNRPDNQDNQDGGEGAASIAASAASEERNRPVPDNQDGGEGAASIAASAASEERNRPGPDNQNGAGG